MNFRDIVGCRWAVPTLLNLKPNDEYYKMLAEYLRKKGGRTPTNNLIKYLEAPDYNKQVDFDDHDTCRG